MEDSIDKLEEYLYVNDEGRRKKRNFGPEWPRLDSLRRQLDNYFKLRVFAFNGGKLDRHTYIRIYTHIYVYIRICTSIYIYLYFSSIRLSMHFPGLGKGP